MIWMTIAWLVGIGLLVALFWAILQAAIGRSRKTESPEEILKGTLCGRRDRYRKVQSAAPGTEKQERCLTRFHSSILRRRSEFVMTDTELKLIAAAAMIGESSRPKNGYRTPAAIGTPAAL